MQYSKQSQFHYTLELDYIRSCYWSHQSLSDILLITMQLPNTAIKGTHFLYQIKLQEMSSTMDMRKSPRSEWLSVRFFRSLITSYTNCSYFLSDPRPQNAFTYESIFSLFVLALIYLAYAIFGLYLPITIIGLLGSVTQILTQAIGHSKYLNNKQPGKRLVIGFVISCIATVVASVWLVLNLYKSGNEGSARVILIFFLLNTVLLYYTTWMILCAVTAFIFGIEAIARLASCQLTNPVNTDVMLPFLFYPRIPGRRIQELGNLDSIEYTQKEHGEAPQCTLCLATFAEGDKAVLLKCHKSHLFHYDCIRLWRVHSDTCPLCRKVVNSVQLFL
eukprot:TRINITY_DN1744_c0_g1_i2.p1 TRINITY_DN1744_c0_g1~~TRINITY_DN1744_c0_g1_i2.p1  ORF type:complete len:332 (-),score=-20.14 TRINITY_DN1744_c0_g1_i2:107-1102(-)